MSDPNFINLLKQLTVGDNFARQAAEAQYSSLKSEANAIAFSLLSVACDQLVEPHIRQLSSVLVRRLLVEDEESVFHRMNKQNQEELLRRILHYLENETDYNMKSKLCDIAGELAGYILDKNHWPELCRYAVSCSQSSSSLDREMGLTLMGYLSNSLVSTKVTTFPQIVNILQVNLQDSVDNGKIIVHSLKALNLMFQSITLESELDEFHQLIPHIFGGLNVLMQCSKQNGLGDASLCVYVENLIEIADEKASFFSSHTSLFFAPVVDLIERSDDLLGSSAVTYLLVEFLVTVCCGSAKKARKLKGPNGEKNYFAVRFLPVCLKLMATLEDETDWTTADTVEEFDSRSSGNDVGESALNRTCVALGVKSTYSIISSIIGPYLTGSTWQMQYAGLQCIGNYLEVSAGITDKAQLALHRSEVVSTLMLFVQNPHPRVRASAYFAVSQFCIMHGSDLKEEQLSVLMGVVLAGIPFAANNAPRVRRNAIIALISLIDVSPAGYLESRAGLILGAITQSLQEGPVIVQESCVSGIISVAETIKGASTWGSHYPSIMPILKQLLQYAQARGLESLWAQTLECCAIVGESSGKQLFYQDALEMMNSLTAMQKTLESNSEPEIFLMKAWVRIARCLGAEFLPYLQHIMDKLFQAMSQEVTVPVDNIDMNDIEERSDLEMIETDDGWIAVRSAAVEEQSTACQLIILLSEKLQEHFYPYVEQTMRLVATLINSPHEDIRSYSIVAIPELVRATGKAMTTNRVAVEELSGFSMGLLIRSVETEATLDLIMTGLQAIKTSLFYACTDWATLAAASPTPNMDQPPQLTLANSVRLLNVAQMEGLTQCAKVVLRDSLQRRAVLRAEAQVSGEPDEEDMSDERLFMQESMELHYNISDLIGAIFRTHGSLFLPVYMEQWHEMVCNLSHAFCLKEDRQFAFFVVSDVMEFGLSRDTAKSYIDQVLPTLIETCKTGTDIGPKRTCAYIIGIACEQYPNEFVPYAHSALQALSTCIQQGDEDGEAKGSCTDNAVSSVGIILERMEALKVDISYQFIWSQWAAYLPLRHDVEEGEKVLTQLLRLIAQRSSSLLMQHERVVRCLSVLLEVMDDQELVSPTMSRNCKQGVHQVFRGFNAPKEVFLTNMAAALSPPQMTQLEAVLGAVDPRSGDFSPTPSSPLATAPIHDVLLRR